MRYSLAYDRRRPKRKQDYGGQRVVSLGELPNRLGTVPAGTVLTVEGWQRGGGDSPSGLVLKTERCSCCGLSFRISRVPEADVRLAEEGE